MLKVLFVCARNQWRSPTAERVFRNYEGIEVSSAGLSPKSKRKLTLAMLEWADIVFVMEDEHKKRIVQEFGGRSGLPEIQSLHIADEYTFMDPELIELFRAQVEPELQKRVCAKDER